MSISPPLFKKQYSFVLVYYEYQFKCQFLPHSYNVILDLHWCQHQLCVNTSVEAYSQYFYLIPFLVLVSTLSPGAYSRFYLIPFHLPTTISQGAYSQLLHKYFALFSHKCFFFHLYRLRCIDQKDIANHHNGIHHPIIMTMTTTRNKTTNLRTMNTVVPNMKMMTAIANGLLVNPNIMNRNTTTMMMTQTTIMMTQTTILMTQTTIMMTQTTIMMTQTTIMMKPMRMSRHQHTCQNDRAAINGTDKHVKPNVAYRQNHHQTKVHRTVSTQDTNQNDTATTTEVTRPTPKKDLKGHNIDRAINIEHVNITLTLNQNPLFGVIDHEGARHIDDHHLLLLHEDTEHIDDHHLLLLPHEGTRHIDVHHLLLQQKDTIPDGEVRCTVHRIIQVTNFPQPHHHQLIQMLIFSHYLHPLELLLGRASMHD